MSDQATAVHRDIAPGTSGVDYRVAAEPWEREAIARLNHRTFTQEIPQHTPTDDGRLIDRFDGENTYLAAFAGQALVGMMAVRARRPFSLDLKLTDLDRFLPRHVSACEIRLLVVDPAWRSGRILLGLMEMLDRHCRREGHDLALISGTVRQLRLYRRLGFQSFGPLVGTEAAWFQPMYLTSERADAMARRFLDPGGEPTTVLQAAALTADDAVNLLPGPVTVRPEVTAAFATLAESHRAPRFVRAMADVQERLRALVGARHVAIVAGSGTLANDAVAGQIGLLGGHGLVLVNGEFGERLAGQAARHRLSHRVHRISWGAAFDWDAVERELALLPEPRWLWVAHCETSTGVLNDLGILRGLAERHEARLCLDGISSIGMVSVDLHGVWLASATSGKALGAYPGLAIVLSSEPFRSGDHLPAVLDLGRHHQTAGVPYTLSSNALAALDVALRTMTVPERFTVIAEASAFLRVRMAARGVPILAAPEVAAAGVLTIPIPPPFSSSDIGDRLADDGILVSYQSGYLLERNWIQLCLLGDERGFTPERLGPVVDRIAGMLSMPPPS
jgi:aspartate aminotransferase-like enzyme/GNAT superfamily N-acetyltransferase